MLDVAKASKSLLDIGHILLTELLLEIMKTTSRESEVEGRIVNVSSSLHPDGYSEGIRFNTINDEARYNRYYAYAQSKLAYLLHTNELTRRLKKEGVKITANSLHPGMIFTNVGCHDLLLSCLFGLSGLFNKTKTVPQVLLELPQYMQPNIYFRPKCDDHQIVLLHFPGAATSCFLALNPQVKGVSGEYFVDSNVGKQSSQAKDADLAKKLWDFSLSLTNAK
ncbi:short-chain dehydrogenase TIC 32, chloroplastic-like [Pyrus communis]|uniref:short-chain dehydrogenase TIC 32, chloroplastic-like n=1 Tax=Pyrus communis TaxID=23211 RepID=UPI0035BF2AC9